MLMHLHVNFFKCNFRYPTLNIIFMSMWIVHASIHACWCSRSTSSHSKETPAYSMSSWQHHTMLHPHWLNGEDDLPQ